ncbi:E4 34k [Murine adenovirus 3]|uniref:E4 34k n=1 Tax=Murine adenovirus 3 TaxID=573199 RepID=C3SAV5_9ADEN|nr:E4 34k [Murine adenovirus 3]ACJ14525.1 E4 34k [Murine adenovirus 3]
MNQMGSCTGLTHAAGVLYSPVGAVAFVAEGALPIPWNCYLSSFDMHFFHRNKCLCLCPITCYRSFQSYITTAEYWSLHCHCGRHHSLQKDVFQPGSLRCLAGGRVRQLLVQKYLQGARFNEFFPHFRSFANRFVDVGLQYVGSIWSGKHFVYVQVSLTNYRRLLNLRGRLGEGVFFCRNALTRYLIIVCEKCSCPPTDEQTLHCMRLISQILRRWQSLLLGRGGEGSLLPGIDFPHNQQEKLRQRLLQRFYAYRSPIYRLTYLRA